LKKYNKKQLIGLLYVLPWIIGFLIFKLYPFIMSFVYSFSDFSMIRPPRFNGLYNFIYIFTKDELFIKSLLNSLKYVVITVPLKLAFAFFVALILNSKLKGISMYRTIYYLPSIFAGSVAVSFIWRFLFMKDGVINNILKFFGLGPISWLGDPKIALFTVSLLAVWQFGSSMVLFLARLKEIPSELIDSALVDGASRFKIFTKITLPMVSPILFFNLVMQSINAFQEFTGPFIITGGGPVNSTYLLSMHIYDNAFRYFRMGYASALSWIQFIVILIFTALIFKSSQYWTYYEYEEGGF